MQRLCRRTKAKEAEERGRQGSGRLFLLAFLVPCDQTKAKEVCQLGFGEEAQSKKRRADANKKKCMNINQKNNRLFESKIVYLLGFLILNDQRKNLYFPNNIQ
uniref:Uncharacterized protein n=1 Tax=Pediastrum duplex TaxID=3105 RepID=A0A2U8GI96_PEDDU|nr:hypothetical protein [Pediastrum duplex]